MAMIGSSNGRFFEAMVRIARGAGDLYLKSFGMIGANETYLSNGFVRQVDRYVS